MDNLTNKIIFSLLFTFLLSSQAQEFSYDFSADLQGWTADFADYPTTDSSFYELTWSRSTLPEPLNTNEYALYISGNNHSDDLFMFIKRKITGLKPNTEYKFFIDLELASNAPTNSIGVGGSPGSSVYIKAGASTIEPIKVVGDNNHYRLNLDKGNQASEGEELFNLGNIGIPGDEFIYTLINRNNNGDNFLVTTNNEGEVWVCIGTDSGFESTTSLYYNKVNVNFIDQNSTAIHVKKSMRPSLQYNTNNSLSLSNFNVFSQPLSKLPYELRTINGEVIQKGTLNEENNLIPLNNISKGTYVFRAKGYTQSISVP